MSDPDFRTQPWAHQLREFDASKEAAGRALLWQMRTGKTKLIVDTACHLFRRGLIDGLVVFAPNGVHDNWLRRELPAHAWASVPWRGLVWRAGVAGASRGTTGATKAQREAHEAWHREFAEHLKDEALIVTTFNSESVTRLDVKALLAKLVKARRLMVVWDESSDYRTPGSKRSKMMRALARKVPYRRILDGTVSENSPLHVWSQYELLDEAALGHRTFASFRQRYGVYESVRMGHRTFPKLVGYQNMEELRAGMARWSSVVRREDCHDLPDVVAEERAVEMTDEQQRIYKEVRKAILLQIGDDDVALGQNKLLKLQQVGSGFLIGEDGVARVIPGQQPRLDAVSDEVMLTRGKVIVWCQFQQDIDMVAKRLRSDGHGVVEYHGRVKQGDRIDAREHFAEGASDEIKVLVGQPQAGGRGLELSAAGTIIWYSHTFDAIVRQQASERATKMAGRNVRMVDFVASATDRYIRDTVERKVSIADDLAGRGLQVVLREMGE